MTFDYRKEYKEFYQPSVKPVIIEIPRMNFAAVIGQGNPNDADGEYQQALAQLYGVTYTIKMSHLGKNPIDGFFKYKLPPLEGLWWQEHTVGIDYSKKDRFQWISMIRLPEFVTEEVFHWAVHEAEAKKQKDFSKAVFFTYREGLCVQCMHTGSYDDEPATIAAMEQYADAQGYQIDITPERYHHEIYLNDPRKCNPARLKTVIRHPIKNK